MKTNSPQAEPQAKTGDLHDYRTGEYIRPATQAETDESIAQASRDGGAGVMSIYVAMDIGEYVSSLPASALADVAGGRWDEVMTDALYAACGATTPDEMRDARATAQELAAGGAS